jgi:hypothetical protein
LRESPKFTKNSRIADFFWFVAGARFFFLWWFTHLSTQLYIFYFKKALGTYSRGGAAQARHLFWRRNRAISIYS